MFEKLSYTKKNVFEEASSEKIKAIYEYAKGYMSYLDNSKTEREAVTAAIALAVVEQFVHSKIRICVESDEKDGAEDKEEN